MFPSGCFPLLRTERLLLREFQLQDRDALLAIYADVDVSRWFLDDPSRVADQIDEILEGFVNAYKNRLGMTWAITLRDTQELIGTCGFERVHVGAEGEIGFDLAKAHWGTGLMTEALNAVIAYGFDHMALATVVADTYSENRRAILMLQRLGFCGEPAPDGCMIFSLQRSDWPCGVA